MFGKNWGIHPKIIIRLYTAVVRPIITYGALVWWPALTRAYNVQKLTRIQRSACAGATGGLRSCPAAALNAILNIIPIEHFIRNTAAQGADSERDKLSEDSRHTLHYMTTELRFGNTYTTIYPTREDWKRGRVTEADEVSLYTDGLKMSGGVGAGIYRKLEASKEWSTKVEHRRSKLCWPEFNRKRTAELISKSKKDIRRIAATITGHWPIGTQTCKMSLPYNPQCRSCKEPSEQETPEHLLCHCPALNKQRARHFGAHQLELEGSQ
ncbi:uncharacterized protein [Drosophila kikkawai]|uniref:Reverse transcriptase n=1 Tax=Drosophila kikkawai TaxID=30033 RepID=A0ABM4GPH5_DROKI